MPRLPHLVLIPGVLHGRRLTGSPLPKPLCWLKLTPPGGAKDPPALSPTQTWRAVTRKT